ncbi:multiple epidermal growth factor-like domains protein 10 isoform X2 [Saccostrea cucullata]|uniref:multiple epidermal growth factor-like domains protein 10 isoform X2 n=1 Tax=Saccostrea cuccullata TaxID=36930 RepID=UPI002ED5055C
MILKSRNSHRYKSPLGILLTVKDITAFLLLIVQSGILTNGPCSEDSFYNGCCPGTSWNSTLQQCLDCSPGLYGENCSHPCLYPKFGDKCTNTCNCNISSCNFAVGCAGIASTTVVVLAHLGIPHFNSVLIVSQGCTEKIVVILASIHNLVMNVKTSATVT